MDNLSRVSDEDYANIYSAAFDDGSTHAAKLDAIGIAKIAFYAGYSRANTLPLGSDLDEHFEKCEESFRKWAKELTSENMPSGWDEIVKAINSIQ